nr:mediator of DNA damage checkpoint protein 1-like [Drosophila kikkawai]
MEPITIDSSDEENTAPNGAYDRPATARDPRMRPGTSYAGRPTRASPTGIRQTRGPTRAPSPPMRPTTSRAPPRRATPRPMSESSDESPPASPPRRAAPPTPPRPSGRSISPFYTDRTGRRIPCSQAPPSGPYQGSHNPDAPGHSRWFYNPGPAPGYPNPTAAPTRDDDYLLEDVTDSDATPPYPGYHGEEASEQDDDDAQTISSDSAPDDGAPSAAHYRWEGEERYGFWRGSWIQLIHNRYTSILIEAPFRPTPDPIITFPPSPERLCIMAPDEDWEMDVGNTPEVRPPSPALGEDAALPIFPGDWAGDNAPLTSTSKQALHINQTYDDAPLASTSQQALRNQTYDDAPLASTSQQALRNQTYDDTPLASSSQGSIPTASETTEQGYQPTGKAMQWESESSDSETETGQKFRRKETRPRPPPNIAAPSHRSSVHRRGISTERNALPNAAEANRRAANHSRSTINEEVTPPATPRVGPGDRGFDLSPGTLDVLMGGARTGSRRASTGVNPRLGPERPSDNASPGHHRRRGPTDHFPDPHHPNSGRDQANSARSPPELPLRASAKAVQASSERKQCLKAVRDKQLCVRDRPIKQIDESIKAARRPAIDKPAPRASSDDIVQQPCCRPSMIRI